MTCFYPQSVYAETSDLTINSEGVLKMTDGAGRKVVLDSSDLYRLKSAVEGMSTPQLKITYHEHTDDCYKWNSTVPFHVETVYNADTNTAATTWKESTWYDVRCNYCKQVVDKTTGNSACAFSGMFIYVTSKVGGIYLIGSYGNTKHSAGCPYGAKKELICGKTEDTIESIELITE